MTKPETQRERVTRLVENNSFQNIILGVIVFNAIILGLETSKIAMGAYGRIIFALDNICVGIFVFELLLKIYARRIKFFTSVWSLFDFFIVFVSLMPGGLTFSVLRALRVLRILRIISVAPRLRRVVEGFISALPGMGSVFLLMMLIFYIASVMATSLFSEDFPQWFGSLGSSAFSLFQIMTLESWSMGIVRPILEVYPYAWIFFVTFIMVTTFAVVNLLVGLIVNSMQDAHEAEDKANALDFRDEVIKRLESIEVKMAELSEKKD